MTDMTDITDITTKRKVAIFGDSILRGIVLDKDGRYILSKHFDWARIENKLNVILENRSRMGSNILGGIARLKDFFTRAPDVKISSAVVEFGGNDCDYPWDKIAADPGLPHPANVEISDFKAQLTHMISLLRQRGVNVILMTLPPISSSRYFKWITRGGLSASNILSFLGGDIEYISRHQELYSHTLMSVAHEQNTQLVDVRKYFLETPRYPDLMCEDGIHPNADGEALITQAFINHFAVC
jgi:Lysophospholipase L1 and related esterases